MSSPSRSSPFSWGLLLGAAGFLALGFLPQMGGPGYEHSLVSGFILPSLASVVTALDISQRERGPAVESLLRGLFVGASLSLLALTAALLHTLRQGLCGVVSGVTFYLLTAGVGALLGGMYGALVGLVVRGRKRSRLLCIALGPALPLLSIAIGAARFLTSPMVFGFDPFVGYFSGSLYDTVIETGTSLITYRAGSLSTIAATFFFAASYDRRHDAALWRRPVFFALLFASASLLVSASGPALGHWETRKSIERELGGHVRGRQCDVVFPEGLPEDESALLARDCDEQLAEVEQNLGAAIDFRITAFFFQNADQKRRLMGAADTYIAKPWRREVYLQVEPYPHPFLGHELAHVVAGSFGRGPFRIAGRLGGLLPDPGLIEGIAVAASPGEGALTNDEWARAMLAEGRLPPPSAIFSSQFYRANAQASYTAAGSFVAFALRTFGSDTVRSWYGGEDLAALTHLSWSALDDRYRATLRREPPLGAATLDAARARFEPPGLFERHCPHAVDALRRDGDKCRDAGKLREAAELYARATELDPKMPSIGLAAAITDYRSGDVVSAKRKAAAVADESGYPRAIRDHALELLADMAWQEGDFEKANGLYVEIAPRTVDEDHARSLEAKALLTIDPAGRTAARPLLLGALNPDPAPFVRGALLASWEASSHAPLASYLVAKNLVGNGDCRAASPFLESADRAAITPRISREVVRLRAVCACRLARSDEIGSLRELVSSDEGPFSHGPVGRRESVLRLLARCAL